MRGLSMKSLFIKKPIAESDMTINVSSDIAKGYYDHFVSFGDKVFVLLGWELVDGDAKFSVMSSGNQVECISSTVLSFSRPDVDRHFGLDSDSKCGVVRVFEVCTPVLLNEDSSFFLSSNGINTKIECHYTDDYLAVSDFVSNMAESEKSAFNDIFVKRYLPEILNKFPSGNCPIDSISGFVRVHSERAFSVKEKGVLLHGWFIDRNKSLESIVLKQGEKISIDLREKCIRNSRPDVISVFSSEVDISGDLGIYSFLELEGFDDCKAARLLLTSREGRVAAYDFNLESGGEGVTLLKSILSPLNLDDRDSFFGLKGFVGDLAREVWDERLSMKYTVHQKLFGHLPSQPECSIVIPLYGRCDFILYQVSQFCKDSDMNNIEVIYVLDDPKLDKECMRLAREVYDVFKYPFRLVLNEVNLGYAGANNLGATYARSEVLLLLNSDVIPKEVGWMRKMLDRYSSLNGCGVLGARLLFEDESIQHDGLEYRKSDGFNNLWLVEHPFKGLPTWMTDNTTVESVPAVTGACMMVSKSIYNQLGGLDTSYILGDFEDSDFCLRVSELGHNNYIDRDVCLYHLERLSQNLFEDTSWKFKVTICNGLKHTAVWNEKLESMK